MTRSNQTFSPAGSKLPSYLRTALHRYFTHLALEKGLSANTISAYRRDLERYGTHVATEESADSFDSIGSDAIGRFLIALRRRGLGARSISRMISSIRGFHHFLVMENLSTVDPSERIDSPRPEKKLPQVLTQAEVLRVLEAARPDSASGLRNRALLETMYATGMRVSEIISLRVQQLLFEQALVRIVGKGNK